MAVITFTLLRDSTGLAGAVRGVKQGTDYVVPVLDLASLPHNLSTAPLPAAGVFVEPWQDRYDDAFVSRLRAQVLADQPGTLYLEQSTDTVTANAVNGVGGLAVVANVPADTAWWPISQRYYRRRFVNGAAGQSVFQLYGEQDVLRPGVHAGVGSLTDRSGTITTANVSQLVAPYNPVRRYLWISNVSANPMWINFSGAATLAQPSIPLNASGIFVMENSFVSCEALNIICGTGGSAFVCKEGS